MCTNHYCKFFSKAGKIIASRDAILQVFAIRAKTAPSKDIFYNSNNLSLKKAVKKGNGTSIKHFSLVYFALAKN